MIERGYAVNAKGKEAEILIYEEIGEGWFGGLSAKQFAKDLKDVGAVDRITLRINSPGGNVFDGNAIYNQLKAHKAEKIVHIDGLAASIASVIAMAGDTINIADNAMMMIHPAWGFVIGNADEMREYAGMLDKVDDSILRTYAKRTGLPDDEIRAMLMAETWMDSAEAVEKGFADEVTDAMEVAACFDLSKFKYRKAPKQKIEPRQTDEGRRAKLARLNLAAMRLGAASGAK